MDLKEKILKDVAAKSEYVTYDDIVENVKEEIHEAMDELSKIVAIAFGLWILSESVLPRYTHWFDAGKHLTTDELFQLFTQSKHYQELMDAK